MDPPELGFAVAYPNPAKSDATLRFSLSRPARVRIGLFDALGRSVSAIVNKAFGPGEHETRWSTSELAPGVYAYRIRIGQLETVRTLAVVK